MAFDMKVRTKQRCVIEFLHAEKIAPIDIHRRLLKVYGNQTVDVSTVRRWVIRFSRGDNHVNDKPRSGRPCTAVNPQNEERLDQLIRANRRITTRELCTELNVGFNALETMLATLGYRKVCAKWVPRTLTQEEKNHRMQVCQDLLNQYEAEGDSFLDRIIAGEETWCNRSEPDSKQHSVERQHANYEQNMQALVHRWRKCIANGGDYVEI